MTNKNIIKKEVTDVDVKRKAVKLVITHLKKKVPNDFIGKSHLDAWILRVDELLAKESFDIKEYFDLKKELNDVIERTIDEEIRFRIRDSWASFGKALDKKVKQK